MKSTIGRTRKRTIISSSESEYVVEKDVQSIIPSASRKSAGKKSTQNVANVPIDKVFFHLPENAQRWKFIFHRMLALVMSKTTSARFYRCSNKRYRSDREL